MKKSDYITRQECAKMLDVNPQSVSNYIKRGLLGGKKIGTTVYILRKEAEIFAEKYIAEIKPCEEHCMEYIASIQEKVRIEEEKFRFLKNENMMRTRLSKIKPMFLTLCCHFQELLSKREFDIIRYYVNGMEISQVAEIMGISDKRVFQLINKAICKIGKAGEEISSRDKRIEELERRCANQHIHIKKLEQTIQNHNNDTKHIQSVKHPSNPYVNVPVANLNLTARCRNALRSLNLNTVGELCEISRKDLLCCRNFGKKTLYELEETLDAIGLKLSI